MVGRGEDSSTGGGDAYIEGVGEVEAPSLADRTLKAAQKKASQHHQRVTGKGDGRGSFSAEEWIAICEQYQGRCALCGYERPLTPDHVVPVALGGPNTIDNIQPLCRPCNMAKYRTPADYRIYDVPRQARSRRRVKAVGTYRPAPKPIWRNDLLDIEQCVREERNPRLGKKERAQTERRWRYIPFPREELVPVLVAEIRRLRKLMLENETLASVETIAWWSRADTVSDILPSASPALASYLESCESRARAAGEGSVA